LDNYIEEVSGTTNFCHRAKEDVPEEERGDVQQRNRSPARLKEVDDQGRLENEERVCRWTLLA